MSFENIIKLLKDNEGNTSNLWKESADFLMLSEQYNKQFKHGQTMDQDSATNLIHKVFGTAESKIINDMWNEYYNTGEALSDKLKAGELTKADYNHQINDAYRASSQKITDTISTLKNSTYRSIKSVLKNSAQYGIPLITQKGEVAGKSAIEAAIKDKKFNQRDEPINQVLDFKRLIGKAHEKAVRLVLNDKYRNSDIKTVTTDLKEMLIDVKSLDKLLTNQLSKFTETK